MMTAIGIAVISGAVALCGKIILDIWASCRTRKTTAAALGGELGAYLRLLSPDQFVQRLHTLAAMTRDERIFHLKAFPVPPISHPVFDKLADKIGGVSPKAARGVSEAYNIVTGVRIHIANFSTSGFLEAPDHVQEIRLRALAEMVKDEKQGIEDTVTLLERTSRQITPMRLVKAALKGLSVVAALIAAGLWFWASSRDIPLAPGAELGGTRADEAFNIALRQAAQLNKWAALATGISVSLMVVADLIAWRQWTGVRQPNAPAAGGLHRPGMPGRQAELQLPGQPDAAAAGEDRHHRRPDQP